MATSTVTDNTPWTIISPYQNDLHEARTVYAPPWVDSPNVRGTFDILQSCILTLLACIYTALHLNVPEETEWYQILWSKIRWTMLALFAPEVVLVTAINQLRQAWRLRKKLRSLQAKSNDDNVDKSFDFNLKYCYFVVMGGVRIDVTEILSFDDLDERYKRHFRSLDQQGAITVRLGPVGLLELAKQGHWNSICFSAKMIGDKSKADYFQKLLVVVQVSWMIIQSIARKAQGLPLTLLEVHTMVHVACAVCLYSCWFKKPLNIEDPQVLKPTDCIASVALLVQRQFYTRWNNVLALGPSQSTAQNHGSGGTEGTTVWFRPTPPCLMRNGDVMISGLTLKGRKDLPITPEFLRRWDGIFSDDRFRNYSNQERRKLEGASTSMTPDHEPTFGLKGIKEFNIESNIESWLYGENLPFVIENRNFEYDGDEISIFDRLNTAAMGPGQTRSSLISWLILPALYGGIHMVAWNWDFPSSIEATLWKISCCWVTCSWVALACAGILLDGGLEEMQAPTIVVKAGALLWFISFCIWYIAYSLSRVYIIIEAFLSLRRVPMGVYITPEWLQMFPHI